MSADDVQRQVAEANASGRTPVVFVHGLWLLASSWDRWAALFEEAGYAPVSPGWPDDPDTVEEAHEDPEVFANKTVGQVADHYEARRARSRTPWHLRSDSEVRQSQPCTGVGTTLAGLDCAARLRADGGALNWCATLAGRRRGCTPPREAEVPIGPAPDARTVRSAQQAGDPSTPRDEPERPRGPWPIA